MQNNTIYKIIAMSITLLMSIASYATDVRIRSQSVDTARELAGWTNHVNLYDMGGMYGTFAITPEYTQSFHSRQIARTLFGNAINLNATSTTNNNNCGDCNDNNGASFRVSGSQATGRLAGDLLADYFGLPLDYQSTVTVNPKIQNFLVDFDFFLGLDEWMCGLWFRIHAPVVYAKWKLRMNEVQANKGTLGYPAGYFGTASVPVANLNTSFISYLQGNVPTLGAGATFKPLTAGLITGGNVVNSADNGNCAASCNSGNHTTRLSDIRAALGWNFWQDEDYHVGLGILAAAPTGNRVNDRLLFQPMVGNGHHWELGGKFTSHYTFWRNCDYNKSFGFYLDIDVTHLFGTNQFRTFDLCGAGDNSKYMLAELMTTTVSNLTAGSSFTVPSSQFDAVFSPIASLEVARTVKVSQDVQVDLTAMFNYTHCGFAWDLGYNFWYTSAEKFRFCPNTTASQVAYALKGDANVFGFVATSPSTAVALSATESTATICTGTNMILSSPAVTATTSVNQRVDNPALAFNAAHVALDNSNTPRAQDFTSLQPVLLTAKNADFQGAKSKGLSNRVFTHLSYTWEDHDCYVPYFGIGGSAEFVSNNNNNSCNSSCATAATCANSSGCTLANNISSCSFEENDNVRRSNISQWGIWIKGGVSFN